MDQAVDYKLPPPNPTVERSPAAAFEDHFGAVKLTPVNVVVGGRPDEVMILAAATPQEQRRNPAVLSPAATELMTVRNDLIAQYPNADAATARQEKLQRIIKSLEASAELRAELGAAGQNGRVPFLDGFSNPRSKPPGGDQHTVMETLYGKETLKAVEEARAQLQKIVQKKVAAAGLYNKDNPRPYQAALAAAAKEQNEFAKMKLDEWGKKAEDIKRAWNNIRSYQYVEVSPGQINSGVVSPFEQIFH